MTRHILTTLVFSLLLTSGMASLSGVRDIVWQWHNLGLQFLDNSVFLADFRDYALLHLAASDTVNYVTGRFQTYYSYPFSAPYRINTSLQAAVISAYKTVFILNAVNRPAKYDNNSFYYTKPGQGAKFTLDQINASAQALFNDQISSLLFQNSTRVQNGIAYGVNVATYVFNQRKTDGVYVNFTFYGCCPTCAASGGIPQPQYYQGCCQPG